MSAGTPTKQAATPHMKSGRPAERSMGLDVDTFGDLRLGSVISSSEGTGPEKGEKETSR